MWHDQNLHPSERHWHTSSGPHVVSILRFSLPTHNHGYGRKEKPPQKSTDSASFTSWGSYEVVFILIHIMEYHILWELLLIGCTPLAENTCKMQFHSVKMLEIVLITIITTCFSRKTVRSTKHVRFVTSQSWSAELIMMTNKHTMNLSHRVLAWWRHIVRKPSLIQRQDPGALVRPCGDGGGGWEGLHLNRYHHTPGTGVCKSAAHIDSINSN